MIKFKVGDRIDLVGRVGTILKVYKTTPNHLGESLTQYEVLWDDTKNVIKGYLGMGFELLEEKNNDS